jgi:hypothetical protein
MNLSFERLGYFELPPCHESEEVEVARLEDRPKMQQYFTQTDKQILLITCPSFRQLYYMGVTNVVQVAENTFRIDMQIDADGGDCVDTKYRKMVAIALPTAPATTQFTTYKVSVYNHDAADNAPMDKFFEKIEKDETILEYTRQGEAANKDAYKNPCNKISNVRQVASCLQVNAEKKENIQNAPLNDQNGFYDFFLGSYRSIIERLEMPEININDPEIRTYMSLRAEQSRFSLLITKEHLRIHEEIASEQMDPPSGRYYERDELIGRCINSL